MAAPSEFGSVVSIRGGIVDIRFENHVPPIHSLLRTGSEEKSFWKFYPSSAAMLCALLH